MKRSSESVEFLVPVIRVLFRWEGDKHERCVSLNKVLSVTRAESFPIFTAIIVFSIETPVISFRKFGRSFFESNKNVHNGRAMTKMRNIGLQIGLLDQLVCHPGRGGCYNMLAANKNRRQIRPDKSWSNSNTSCLTA